VLGGFKRMKSDFGGLKGGSSSSRFCFGIPPIQKHTQLWGLPRTGGSRPTNCEKFNNDGSLMGRTNLDKSVW